jgi:hypothetical protein
VPKSYSKVRTANNRDQVTVSTMLTNMENILLSSINDEYMNNKKIA